MTECGLCKDGEQNDLIASTGMSPPTPESAWRSYSRRYVSPTVSILTT